MENLFTIGQAADRSDLTTKAIRFYESTGLIKPVKRKGNNYRYFNKTQIKELTLIKKIRELGLPITEIKKLMSNCGKTRCNVPKEELIANINSYLETVNLRIEEMTRLRSQLKTLKSRIEDGSSFDGKKVHCCNLLKQLSEISKGGDNK